jgi:hypothetical protein
MAAQSSFATAFYVGAALSAAAAIIIATFPDHGFDVIAGLFVLGAALIPLVQSISEARRQSSVTSTRSPRSR